MNKPIIKRLSLVFGTLLLMAGIALAQAPPPPSENQSGQFGTAPLGGSAPLAAAPGLMLALAAAYGFKKVLRTRNNVKT